ncbi:hypothetical protein CPC08DRAFT_727184 [Agrocybe pediades]|nr:hypothetical protein CPC08DRAFT_727184 [Agrocybe pediades]
MDICAAINPSPQHTIRTTIEGEKSRLGIRTTHGHRLSGPKSQAGLQNPKNECKGQTESFSKRSATSHVVDSIFYYERWVLSTVNMGITAVVEVLVICTTSCCSTALVNDQSNKHFRLLWSDHHYRRPGVNSPLQVDAEHWSAAIFERPNNWRIFSKLAPIAITSLTLVVEAMSSLLLKTAGPDAVNTVGDLRVVTTLTNTENKSSKLLNQLHTVLSGLPSNNLHWSNINFTNSGEVEYDISPRKVFYIVNADSSISPFEAETSSHSEKVSGALAISRSHSLKSKRATFNACNADQQAVIQNVVSPAAGFVVASLILGLILTSGICGCVMSGAASAWLRQDLLLQRVFFGYLPLCGVICSSRSRNLPLESYFTFNGSPTGDIEYSQDDCGELP